MVRVPTYLTKILTIYIKVKSYLKLKLEILCPRHKIKDLYDSATKLTKVYLKILSLLMELKTILECNTSQLQISSFIPP